MPARNRGLVPPRADRGTANTIESAPEWDFSEIYSHPMDNCQAIAVANAARLRDEGFVPRLAEVITPQHQLHYVTLFERGGESWALDPLRGHTPMKADSLPYVWVAREKLADGSPPSFAAGGPLSSKSGDGQPGAPRPAAAEEFYHPGGFLDSKVAGRTDHLALAVPVDSHVIPADVVSGIGEGNSLNGAALLDRLFHAGPWGARAAKINERDGVRTRPLAANKAPEPTTSIMAAGGEYVVRPEAVRAVGRALHRMEPRTDREKGDMDRGHDAIDRFILRARKHVIATTRKLPGPVKG